MIGQIHLYGKTEAKVNRKMGHVTILTDNIEDSIKEIAALAFGRNKRRI